MKTIGTSPSIPKTGLQDQACCALSAVRMQRHVNAIEMQIRASESLPIALEFIKEVYAVGSFARISTVEKNIGGGVGWVWGVWVRKQNGLPKCQIRSRMQKNDDPASPRGRIVVALMQVTLLARINSACPYSYYYIMS